MRDLNLLQESSDMPTAMQSCVLPQAFLTQHYIPRKSYSVSLVGASSCRCFYGHNDARSRPHLPVATGWDLFFHDRKLHYRISIVFFV